MAEYQEVQRQLQGVGIQSSVDPMDQSMLGSDFPMPPNTLTPEKLVKRLKNVKENIPRK